MEANESRIEAPGPTETQIHAAADSYQGPMLAAYDWVVLGLVSRLVWRCPRRTMPAHYNRQVGGSHLDIGPGTGWFLDKCRFPAKSPFAARRIRRYRPVTRTKVSSKLLGRLNSSDVFSNTDDTRDDIAHELSARFPGA